MITSKRLQQVLVFLSIAVSAVILYAQNPISIAQLGTGTVVTTTVPVSGTVTAISGTAANLKAEVVGTGTFVVQAAQATASSLNAEVQGDAAHDAVVSGNPVLVGGYASNTAPAAVSGAGDAVRAWLSLNGAHAMFAVDTSGNVLTPSADATHDSAVITTGPQIMWAAASTAPAAVTAGDAVRPWADLSGRPQVNVSQYAGTAADPCGGAKTYVPFSISTATTTQLIAASASNYNYICSINIIAAAADNVGLIEDDTSACASPTAGMSGGTTAAAGWNFAANGGLTFGNGGATVFKTAATNRYTCLITSAAVQLSGTISYVQVP